MADCRSQTRYCVAIDELFDGGRKTTRGGPEGLSPSDLPRTESIRRPSRLLRSTAVHSLIGESLVVLAAVKMLDMLPERDEKANR